MAWLQVRRPEDVGTPDSEAWRAWGTAWRPTVLVTRLFSTMPFYFWGFWAPMSAPFGPNSTYFFPGVTVHINQIQLGQLSLRNLYMVGKYRLVASVILGWSYHKVPTTYLVAVAPVEASLRDGTRGRLLPKFQVLTSLACSVLSGPGVLIHLPRSCRYQPDIGSSSRAVPMISGC